MFCLREKKNWTAKGTMDSSQRNHVSFFAEAILFLHVTCPTCDQATLSISSTGNGEIIMWPPNSPLVSHVISTKGKTEMLLRKQ